MKRALVTSSVDDDDLLRRAFAAYFRAAGDYQDQPSRSSEVVIHKRRKYVVLRGGRDVLTVYRVRPDGILRRMKRWPAEIA